MKTFILMLMIMFISVTLSAQTTDEAVNLLEDETGIGVKALGMGNAFVAVANDYSATYWNPAGLTMIGQSELSADVYHIKFMNEATYSGNTLQDDRSFTKLNSLGLAYKFPTMRGNFVLSFGYNRFKDLEDYMYFNGYSSVSNGLEFELEDENGESAYHPFDNNVLRTEQITQDGNLSAWSIGGGLMLSENFALGLTVNFFTGASHYVFDFFQDDVDNLYSEYPADYQSYEFNQRIDSEFSGWGIKLGSLFHMSEQLRFGFTVDFPSRITVLENYGFRDGLYFDDGYASEYEDEPGEWQYDIVYPFKFSGGVALDMGLLLVAGSIEYRDWSQVKFDKPDGRTMDQDYQDLLNDNSNFPDLYREVLSYSGGAELRVPGTGIKLRGGYQYVPSPFIGASEEQDKQYFSAGFGYDADESAAFNVSVRKGFWKRSTYDDFTPGGTLEDISTTRFMAGITIRM